MKKSILLLCAATIVMGSFAKVGDTFTTGNLTYEVTGENDSIREVAVVAPQSTEITAATIPATVSNGGVKYSVAGIRHKAFADCALLTTVTLPKSLTWIGAYSFGGCTALTAVTIPSSVGTIGRQAFAGCTSLAKVTLKGDVARMDDDVFLGCTALQSVALPASLSKVGSGMFERCENLSSVSFGNAVATIGNYAFAGSAMESLTVPAGTGKVADGAFADSWGERRGEWRGTSLGRISYAQRQEGHSPPVPTIRT